MLCRTVRVGGLFAGHRLFRLTIASSNCFVDNLKQKAVEIETNPLLLTSNVLGWCPGQI